MTPSNPLEKLSKDERLFFSAFQFAAIGMALVAPDGKWLMVNKALCHLVGYTEKELMALTFQDITHPEDLEQDLKYVEQMLAGTLETYQMEKRYFHKNGNTIHILLSVSLVRDDQDTPLFFISQIQDITARKRLEQELFQQATEDALTRVSNRRRFFDLAEREITRGWRYNDPMVLLMLDIDHFKKINDQFGHSIGDNALKHMADICRKELRSVDAFGRIGGEEFCALLVKTDAFMGKMVAERLRRAVETASMPTDKGNLNLTVSIGGVAFSGSGNSLDLRMKQADQAMYDAKSRGRNRIVMIDDLADLPGKTEGMQTSFVRLAWNKAYECGHEEIDAQHRKLFQCANNLLSAMIARQDRAHCQRHIDELVSEIRAHFKTETRIIKTAGYPEATRHDGIHQALLAKLVHMIEHQKNGHLELAEVFNFIAVDVISQHMLDEDRKFFDYLADT